jgi:hypothetical protein
VHTVSRCPCDELFCALLVRRVCDLPNIPAGDDDLLRPSFMNLFARVFPGDVLPTVNFFTCVLGRFLDREAFNDLDLNRGRRLGIKLFRSRRGPAERLRLFFCILFLPRPIVEGFGGNVRH